MPSKLSRGGYRGLARYWHVLFHLLYVAAIAINKNGLREPAKVFDGADALQCIALLTPLIP